MAETTFTLWRQRLGYGIADLSCNLVWQMISVSDVLLHRRHGSPGLLCRPDVPGNPAGRRRGRRADGAGDRQYHHPLGALPPWLLIGALPFGLLCILAFYVPDFGTTGKLLYAFVTYLCLSFLYTTGEYSVLRHAAVFNQ